MFDENKNIKTTELSDELRKSFLDYSMSVIVSRAIPDVRDGLKPVHRRIIYAMNELKINHQSVYKKSARIVGEVIGKYHPHGDSAVYDAMVRMAQDFNYRYPLIDGHGNFGSIDGDGAAAMRYTEVRLSKISSELVKDIKKNTINFSDNYDGTEREPEYLTSYIPNILINGSSGIAVGMATKIPPHNICEVIDAITLFIDNPHLTTKELLLTIKGPDFPTGAYISGLGDNLIECYEKGRGSIDVRSLIEEEQTLKTKKLIIKEIPYQVNKAKILEKISELVKKGTIKGIKDLREETNRHGIRVVIELKKYTDEKIVLNKLYKHTSLQTTYSFNLLALHNGSPKIMSLREIISFYIEHQIDVLVKKTNFDLLKSEKKLIILEGLFIAINNINEVINVIKKSRNTEDAKINLMENFNLQEIQSLAILEMRLQRLTNLEKESILKNIKELKELIEELKSILNDEQKQKEIIKNNLKIIRKEHGDERKTKYLIEEFSVINKESLVQNNDAILLLTKNGYIKRVLDTFKLQKKGGIGIKALSSNSDDQIIQILKCQLLDKILFITKKGKLYIKKAFEFEESSKNSRGQFIKNFINLDRNDQVHKVLKLSTLDKDKEQNILLLTKKGLFKKIRYSEVSNLRSSGKRIIIVKNGDEVADAIITKYNDRVLISNNLGRAVVFKLKDLKFFRTNSMGVIGIRNKSNAFSTKIGIINSNDRIGIISKSGYGKIVNAEKLRVTSRGATGFMLMNKKFNEKSLSGIIPIKDDTELIIATSANNIIKLEAKQLRMLSRLSLGSKVINISDSVYVTAVEYLN